MRQTLIITGQLATLNEHDNANRVNRFAGAALKKRMTEHVAHQAASMEPLTNPVFMDYEWFISTRHDYDNIAFARKYVQDGVVHAGKLPNDNQQ